MERLGIIYDVPPPNLKEDTWLHMGNTINRRKIYSAFYDDRLAVINQYTRKGEERIAGVIRLIGILPYKINDRLLQCHLNYNYSSSDYTIETSVRVRAIKEHKKLPFAASFIVCGVFANIFNSHTGGIMLPHMVAISDGSLPKNHLTFIPVRYPLETNRSESKTLAVCVPPLFQNYNEDLALTEYIEIYRLLGASHMYFYNSSISSRVSRVLEYYKAKGWVTVQDWNLTGYKFEIEVRYNGIFAALNDCLYRASIWNGYDYVVNTDMDEVLMPYQHEDLLALLASIHPSYAGIIFKNAFFHMSAENQTSLGSNYLITQSKIIRSTEILPSGVRSKYICKGKGVIEIGNHFIWKYIPGYYWTDLKVDEGLSHHYRLECMGYCSDDGVVDKSARRYEGQLSANVDKAYSEIFNA